MAEAKAGIISNQANPVPRRLMIVTVCLLCLGLLGSAIFTFATLLRMRAQYLSNRGHEIVEAIDLQARGPGRRNNPDFWQALFEENYEHYSGRVAFLALVDSNGTILASKGTVAPGSPESPAMDGADIYRFEEPLGRARNRQGIPVHPTITGWRVQVGLYASDADFIRRTAYMQLAVSGLAILALSGLLVYLLHVLRRFVEIKVREGAEVQLKSLGIMAASLAHEIRNPLGAIKGLTQLAQEELPPDNASHAHLRTVVSEAERLENLVTNLLDFARPKEPEISEFDAAELLADVQNLLRPRLEETGVGFRLRTDSAPLRVRSDPAGLRQVLLNVLLNAIDASPRGRAVTLAGIFDDGKRFLVLQIDDEGPGLGGRDSDEFFQPFLTTKARGTGLGLAISRQILERLGGTIALAENPQGGVRCSIRLPVGDSSNFCEKPSVLRDVR